MSGRDRIHRPDDLAAARGVFGGLLLSVPLWLVIYAVWRMI